MNTVKAKGKKSADSLNAIKKGVNPFEKLMDDKERIANAVNTNQPLTSLTDIKFVRPV